MTDALPFASVISKRSDCKPRPVPCPECWESDQERLRQAGEAMADAREQAGRDAVRSEAGGPEAPPAKGTSATDD